MASVSVRCCPHPPAPPCGFAVAGESAASKRRGSCAPDSRGASTRHAQGSLRGRCLRAERAKPRGNFSPVSVRSHRTGAFQDGQTARGRRLPSLDFEPIPISVTIGFLCGEQCTRKREQMKGSFRIHSQKTGGPVPAPARGWRRERRERGEEDPQQAEWVGGGPAPRRSHERVRN